jgi:hypothetical protein
MILLQTISFGLALWFSVAYIAKLIQNIIPHGRHIKGYASNLMIAILFWCILYFLTHK